MTDQYRVPISLVSEIYILPLFEDYLLCNGKILSLLLFDFRGP